MAAQTIQVAWRAAVARKKAEQESAMKIQTKALKIQRLYRGYFVRRQNARRSAAALTIQRMWRGQRQRMEFNLVIKRRDTTMVASSLPSTAFHFVLSYVRRTLSALNA